MNVMVVVADPAMVQELRGFFAHRGHELTMTSSSAEAREHLGEGTCFTFVLVDLEIDQAVDLCRTIHELPDENRPYSLVLTPAETVQAMRPALAAGADDYISKPLELSALQLRLAIGERRLVALRNAGKDQRFREQYFRSLLENSSDLITIVDAFGHILYQSASSTNLLGWSADEMMGWNLLEHLHPDDRERFSEVLAKAQEERGATCSAQCRLRHRSGDFRYFDAICKNLLDDPVVGGMVVTSRDIGEHHRLEAELTRERVFFQQLFRNSPSAIVILDQNDRVVDANDSFLKLFDYELADIKRQAINECIVPEELHEEAAGLSRSIFSEKMVAHETSRRRRDGTPVEVSIIGYPIEISGRMIGAFGIYSDITERKQAERKLYHHAFHDALTGLPNRSLLSERLKRALRRTQRQAGYSFALLFIDLDRFKVINDSLGHEAGDELLIEMSRRLESCVRPGDTVARLGGDEFTIILEDLQEPKDATRVADRILTSLAAPFMIAGQEIGSSGSIGIAYSAGRYKTPDELMRDADIAMYKAKLAGKARYAIFDAEMHQHAMRRLELETELRRAIENQELALYYHPMVSLSTRRVLGFEALVNWPHPTRGLLTASELIPICEETGLIVELGRWVLAEACRQAVVWQTRFPKNNCLINVNLSAKEALNGDFLELVDRVRKETQVKPASIGFEMNENMVASSRSEEEVLTVLWELRNRGYRLYIDAFGTGHSSLSALHRFPIDALKIDRSFVRQMSSGDSQEIIRAIAALGETLGLMVIAEGVESRDELARVRELGLPFAQGHLFTKPVPPEKAEKLLRAGPLWKEEAEKNSAN